MLFEANGICPITKGHSKVLLHKHSNVQCGGIFIQTFWSKTRFYRACPTTKMSLLDISYSYYWEGLASLATVRDTCRVMNRYGQRLGPSLSSCTCRDRKGFSNQGPHILCFFLALPMHPLFVLSKHIICVLFLPPFISSFQTHTHTISSHASMCVLLKPIFFFPLLLFFNYYFESYGTTIREIFTCVMRKRQ